MKVKLACTECDAKYTISSHGADTAQYCPFCGEPTLTPAEDMHDDDEVRHYEDEEPDGDY